jgi:maleate cis-trans isomerase
MMTGIRRNPNIGHTKVGLILPSVNCIIEPEFYQIAPKGISFHATRVFLAETTPAALIKMEEDLDAATRLMATVNPDAVIYACTSGSFIKGLGWDREIIAKIEAAVGCPATTPSTAMIQALQVLGIQRVAVATPYLDVVNKREEEFLVQNGFEVVACRGLGLSGPAVREATPETVVELVRSVDRPEADGIFVSCTDFRAMEVIDLLEQELGKPVTSSNQVSLWALLKILDHPERVLGYGRLLAEMP